MKSSFTSDLSNQCILVGAIFTIRNATIIVEICAWMQISREDHMDPYLEEENRRLRKEIDRLHTELASIHVALNSLAKLVGRINEVTLHEHGNTTKETKD
jgi:hypothetical protein